MREWLIKRRIDMNKSQNDLAKACNITNSYYCMIEAEKRNPSTKVAKLIANELDFNWINFFAS